MVEKEVILSGTVHKHVLYSFSSWFQSRRAANVIKEALREIGSRLPEVSSVDDSRMLCVRIPVGKKMRS